ncbi:hypothetical protein GH714_034524 [Hevea brasiliensis]|uniref:DDE Tnp4 domain-containing protein n=1 Tax=Hevea brasiliensis TaxID=3981 RepID=A0A6A6KWF6_HEVBR|nr:hypothetical protein GH714_034524 [Hevea brasiliensis]
MISGRKKIKAKLLFEKFLNQGIPTRLRKKYDILFMDTVATREHAWAPSIGVLLDDDDDNGVSDNVEKAHSKDVIRLEGTSDSEEESNFLKDLDQIVNNEIQGTQRMGSDSTATKRIQVKQGKRVDMSSKQGKKDNKTRKMKTQSSGSTKLSQKIDRLVAMVESRGTITSKRNDLPRCTIPEVYEQLNALPKIEKGNELWHTRERFQHSGEAISRVFRQVFNAVCLMPMDIIKPIDLEFSDTPPEILNDIKYMPHFKDCIGAIDGTHVRASIAPEDQIPYIGRKEIPTQTL